MPFKLRVAESNQVHHSTLVLSTLESTNKAVLGTLRVVIHL
jgi:hypothetical protein